jgi:hypothetical protein
VLALFVVCAAAVVVFGEPFAHYHGHHTASSSGSASGSGESASGSASASGYHYPKPKKPFYLPAASHTKIKIIKHHGKKIKKVKKHHSTYSAPSSSASGSASGSGSGESGSGSGASGHGHHYKPHVKVIIKKHSKIHHG